MRVLAVCLGNICRSPTVEAAIREAAAARGLQLEVDSAGTGDWHIGERPDARMRAAAADAGLDLTGRARQVEPADLGTFDLVLAMDRDNLRVLQGFAVPDARVALFRDWDPELPAGDPADVPDPYYGGTDGFRTVVAIARRTARALVEELAAGR
jgi:protein-tyrosine phosphatase